MDDVKLLLALAAALVWLLWITPLLGSLLFGGRKALGQLKEFTQHVGGLIAFVMVMSVSVTIAVRIVEAIM